MTANQIIGHQERELVGCQRAFALMADGEAARRAQRVQVEARVAQGRLLAHVLERGGSPLAERVEPETLEHAERRPLRHALGQPLLCPALALGQLDLRHVRQLVGDQA